VPRINRHFRTHDSRLLVASRRRPEGPFDAVYIPQVAHFTGDLDTHDLAFDPHGRILFVNTLFSCLSRVSESRSFTAIWKPPFTSRLAAEDRCHLNGLALKDGRPAFATAVSTTDVTDGWREHRRDGGVIVDIATGAGRGLAEVGEQRGTQQHLHAVR
jgi:uncharacterized protein (TIGR03032 family)